MWVRVKQDFTEFEFKILLNLSLRWMYNIVTAPWQVRWESQENHVMKYYDYDHTYLPPITKLMGY